MVTYPSCLRSHDWIRHPHYIIYYLLFYYTTFIFTDTYLHDDLKNKVYDNNNKIIFTLLYDLLNSDIDECTDGPNDCDNNAECDNTVGSFTCTCNTGYSGNGVTCAGTDLFFINV